MCTSTRMATVMIIRMQRTSIMAMCMAPAAATTMGTITCTMATGQRTRMRPA